MLILMIFESGVNSESKLRLVQINHQSVLIRKLLSFCVRISSFNSDNLKEMGIVARSLFKLSCLCDNRLSPSLWTLCNVTPHHASVCLQQYNLGLGCNTMEGREQKHQAISRYAENTTFQNRWPLIFRHEFIQLIHLRENGFDKISHIKRSKPYVPVESNDACTKCQMKFTQKEIKCRLCDSQYQDQVNKLLKKHDV